MPDVFDFLEESVELEREGRQEVGKRKRWWSRRRRRSRGDNGLLSSSQPVTAT
jgi:hypothetical protein